ncbi:hypothetical protein B0H10DRAFT_777764 [Mycena sp. CBHHK59/15]|nr:hypothetical protein B0H10DRAFT_777764 [Mycena sp. CBHHK59/15]
MPTTSTRAAPAQKKHRRSSTPTDDDVDMGNTSATHIDPTRPWLDEFNEYLQASETMPEGTSTIEWWGVRFVTIIATRFGGPSRETIWQSWCRAGVLLGRNYDQQAL